MRRIEEEEEEKEAKLLELGLLRSGGGSGVCVSLSIGWARLLWTLLRELVLLLWVWAAISAEIGRSIFDRSTLGLRGVAWAWPTPAALEAA